MTRAFLALGANIGNKRENLRLALRLIGERSRVIAVSSLYASKAIVLEGAPPGPDYLNAACEIETDLPAPDLLAAVKTIEHRIGRRPAERWAPRPIDIDILLYGDEIIDAPELTVPHPRIAERNFFVAPLAELAPDAALPGDGRAVGELAEDMDFEGLEHVEGPEWAGNWAPDANDAAR